MTAKRAPEPVRAHGPLTPPSKPRPFTPLQLSARMREAMARAHEYHKKPGLLEGK